MYLRTEFQRLVDIVDVDVLLVFSVLCLSILQPPMQQPAAVQQPKSDWTEHTAPDGTRKYYFNSKTQQSTWVKPEELMTPEVRCVVLCCALLYCMRSAAAQSCAVPFLSSAEMCSARHVS